MDIPVAIIFFNRPDLLEKTFEPVKLIEPSKLFLIQDGPRENNLNDTKKIEECRKLVSNVDWPCEVFFNYSEDNLGCGMRVYTGLSWVFEHVDRLVILEDDCVASKSFFPFCEELLERYKDDERVDMISGMNHLGIYSETPNDYFFSNSASPWGWATWKRVWDTVDYNMTFLDDPYLASILRLKLGKQFIDNGISKSKLLKTGKNLSSWTYQKGASTIINSRLVITPKYNLITNIGLNEEGTNTPSRLETIPKQMRKVYYLKSHELSFPIRHPNNMIDDVYYTKQVNKIMGAGNSIIKFNRKIQSVILRIIYGDYKSIIKGLKRRILR